MKLKRILKYERRDFNLRYIFAGISLNFMCTAISLLYGGRINIITVFWLIITSLMGCSIGMVYNNTEKFREIYKYKGIFLYILMMIFDILWMPLLYRADNPILALVDVVITGIFSFFVIYYYSKVNYTAFFVMLLYQLWILIIIVVNITYIH